MGGVELTVNNKILIQKIVITPAWTYGNEL